MTSWYFDSLVQDCSNSIGKGLELLQSSTKLSILRFGGDNGAVLQLSGCIVEILEVNFIPHVMMYINTYPWWY